MYRQRVGGLLDQPDRARRHPGLGAGPQAAHLLLRRLRHLGAAGSRGPGGRDQQATRWPAGRLWEVQGDSRFGDVAMGNETQRMLDSFGAADVVVHTVDVTGLTADADVSSFGRGVAVGTGARDSLASIAAIVGRPLHQGANDLSTGLDDILESTRVHYLLAFEPGERSGAGRSHRIEVKARTKGLQVSHRTRTRSPRPIRCSPQMARRLQAGEAIAKGMSGGEIAMQMLALPYRTEAGILMIPVVAHVPAEALLGGRSRPWAEARSVRLCHRRARALRGHRGLPGPARPRPLGSAARGAGASDPDGLRRASGEAQRQVAHPGRRDGSDRHPDAWRPRYPASTREISCSILPCSCRTPMSG